MHVVICIPDSEERAFCRRRIEFLSKNDGIATTIDEIKASEIGNKYFNWAGFDDTDLIYIGINSNFNGIAIAKAIRKAGLNAVIVFFYTIQGCCI